MAVARRRITQDGTEDIDSRFPGDGGDFGVGGPSGGGKGPADIIVPPSEYGPGGVVPTHGGSNSEDPRSRPTPRSPMGPGGGPRSAPPRPAVPTPGAGSVSQGPGGGPGAGAPGAMPPPGGVVPFPPMGGPGGAEMASPRRRGLYGSMGGLTGGGLGVPLSPTPVEETDHISALIKMLTGGF